MSSLYSLCKRKLNNKKKDGNKNESNENVGSILHCDDDVSLSSISEKHDIVFSGVLSIHTVEHR
jgi:hypothetical protein